MISAEKLVAALKHQKFKLQSGDIVVVKHKIVSKAEGQVVPLNTIIPSLAAKAWSRKTGTDARVIELALSESKRIVRKKKGVLITETRHGFICANSGVDVSNVDGGESAVLSAERSGSFCSEVANAAQAALSTRILPSSSLIHSGVHGAKD